MIHEQIVADLHAANAHPVIYELGCGQRPEPGCVGLDLFATGEGIHACNLYALPWRIDCPAVGNERWCSCAPPVPGMSCPHVIPDASVDYLVATHFLEHVPSWDAHFREVYRVLKPGGYYKIIAPYHQSVRAWMDPDHKQPISEHRFLYLNQEWLRKNKRDHFGLGRAVNFEVLNNQFFYAWSADYVGKDDVVREFARAHYYNVVDDIALILRKLPLMEDQPNGVA